MTWVRAIFNKLAAHMSDLRGADFKIAFYLVSQVVATGNAEISLSERALSDAVGVSLSTIRAALVRLEVSGLFLRERGGYHQKDRYLLPAFRLPDGVSEIGTRVPEIATPGVPEIGTQSAHVDLVGVSEIGTQVYRKSVHSVPENGTPEAVFDPPPYKVRARASVESNSSVLEVESSIDRVLRTRTLRPDQAEDADGLRRSLYGFMSTYADPSVKFREVDDAIVAQCLAIAPLPALRNCLDDLRARRVPPFQTFAFFVTVFLKSFIGCSPAQVKARRTALRVTPKPPKELTKDEPFHAALISQLVSSVPGLG